MSTASDPSLIDVIVGTFPDLYLIGVGKVAVCEIEAETLKTMSDPVKGKANALSYLDWSERFYHRQCKTNSELEGYQIFIPTPFAGSEPASRQKPVPLSMTGPWPGLMSQF